MSETQPNPVGEENVERMVTAALPEPRPGFEDELVERVLSEVNGVRGRRRVAGFPWRRGIFAACAASAAAIIWVVVMTQEETPEATPEIARSEAGRIRPEYGLVSLRNGTPARMVDQVEDLRPGEWIRTHSGSRASIVLPDKSRLTVQPRTLVQVDAREHGGKVSLQEGSIRVTATEQPPGESLTIEAPGSRIEVLGTRLDVHVVRKPDGRKRTSVTVLSGEVALESGGKRVRLLPNMEGMAEEGKPPVTRSITVEVNEMALLLEKTDRLAAEADVSAGAPTIIDFNGDATATVWTVASIENTTSDSLREHLLTHVPPGCEIAAFTREGASLPVDTEDGRWRIDLSLVPVPPAQTQQVIVRVTNVEGWFERKGRGSFEFSRPESPSKAICLCQFRLPSSAVIEEAFPKPIETRRTPARLVVTIAATSQHETPVGF